VTQATISFDRGDVVLVGFQFADQSGTKNRPALVISSDRYHRSRREVIVAAITSNTGRLLLGDYLVGDWQAAGLLFPSTVTGIVRTVVRSMINRRIGSVSEADLSGFDAQLRRSLAL
jgi:mRNA interferase MazF